MSSPVPGTSEAPPLLGTSHRRTPDRGGGPAADASVNTRVVAHEFGSTERFGPFHKTPAPPRHRVKPRDHISAVLNHIEGGPAATRVYDRYSRDAEKRIALETWARKLAAITVEKKGAGSVVPITAKAKGRRAT